MSSADGDPSAREAGEIIAACGIDARMIRHIGAGAQSQVWLIESDSGRYTLRIGVPRRGERNSYESEAAIRQELVRLGAPVARPVRTSRIVVTGAPRDWSLDEYVVGGPKRPEKLTAQEYGDIGALLSKLHDLPAEGYGLLQNRGDVLAGEWRTPQEGILSRLDRPWPFTGEPLDTHPIITERPEFFERLRAIEPAILELVEGVPRSSVLHSDLHPGQFLFHNGRLAALIDFGEAVAGPPFWDIASFAYFFGWGGAKQMLEGYARRQVSRRSLEAEGRLFAIVLALHHAGRAGPLNQPPRMEGAVRYLRANLP